LQSPMLSSGAARARIETVEHVVQGVGQKHLPIPEADCIVSTHHDAVGVPEAAIAIFAALRAHSVVLLGFGAHSGISRRSLCSLGSRPLS